MPGFGREAAVAEVCSRGLDRAGKAVRSAISPACRGAAIYGCHNPKTIMKLTSIKDKMHRLEQGKIGYILMWLLGIPLPVLLIIYLLQGH